MTWDYGFSIELYYSAALDDYSKGATLEQLEEVINVFEQDECYEGCAGVLKAIEFIKQNKYEFKGH